MPDAAVPARKPGKPRLATVWLGGCSGCHMSLLDMDEALATVSEINPRMLTITRTGSTASPEHLRSVGVERAKSIVVVSSADSADADPDAVLIAIVELLDGARSAVTGMSRPA